MRLYVENGPVYNISLIQKSCFTAVVKGAFSGAVNAQYMLSLQFQNRLIGSCRTELAIPQQPRESINNRFQSFFSKTVNLTQTPGHLKLRFRKLIDFIGRDCLLVCFLVLLASVMFLQK